VCGLVGRSRCHDGGTPRTLMPRLARRSRGLCTAVGGGRGKSDRFVAHRAENLGRVIDWVEDGGGWCREVYLGASRLPCEDSAAVRMR
jgi:hypothetical protein